MTRTSVAEVMLATLMLLTTVAGCKSNDVQEVDDDAPPGEAEQALEKNQEAPMPTSPLAVGQEVFDFTALAHTGQRVELGKSLDRPVVVYFCPSDRAPPCTDLALALKQSWLEMNAHLSMVYAVTPEPTVVHRDFATEHELPHVLLSDESGVVHRMFGLTPGVVASYLLGKDRKVLAVLSAADGAAHVAAIRQALSEQQLLQTPFPL